MRRLKSVYKKHPFLYAVLGVFLFLIPTLFLMREKTGFVSQRISQTASCDAQTIACDLQFQENKSSACGAFQSLAVDNLISRDDSPCKGMDRAVVERVLQDACTNGCINSTITPIATGEPTQVPSSTASPSPTTVPTLTKIPTAGLSATPSPSTMPAKTNVIVEFSLKRPGIGKGLSENPRPIMKQTRVFSAIYDSSNPEIILGSREIVVEFDGDTYNGKIPMNFPEKGEYVFGFNMENSLPIKKNVFINLDETVKLPRITLTPGDMAPTDGVLDIFDFNELINCYGDDSCVSKGADLNSDGIIDAKDLNILLRSFALRTSSL